jgi:hypothetical protein
MTTITLWLLISVNSNYYSAESGHYTVIDRFPTVADCEHVQRSLPENVSAKSRCIQAKVVR